MATGLDFAGMVPGFDFLQGLMKGAGSALPSMGQWVAPTLDPEELDKRINELRTVQFWLEQNAKLLGTTIQAMEVQRMTLNTLQTMNLPMADLREALTIKTPARPAPSAAAPSPAPTPAPTEDATPDKPAPAAIDPMQWWGALTQQFTDIASQAIQAGAADAARAAQSASTTAAKPAKAAAAVKKAGKAAKASAASTASAAGATSARKPASTGSRTRRSA